MRYGPQDLAHWQATHSRACGLVRPVTQRKITLTITKRWDDQACLWIYLEGKYKGIEETRFLYPRSEQPDSKHEWGY